MQLYTVNRPLILRHQPTKAKPTLAASMTDPLYRTVASAVAMRQPIFLERVMRDGVCLTPRHNKEGCRRRHMAAGRMVQK